jgi:hypothetical protein
MPEIRCRARRAVQIENESLRLTVLAEGGHLAELLHKASGVNPLWTPPWPSIEPSTYDRVRNPEYGSDAESKLLAGLMGHNLCLDLFGGPSAEEAAAGITVHGEAPVAPFRITESAEGLIAAAHLPAAQLRFERRIRLEGPWVRISESVENLSPLDRPVAWTEHVTIGPPFLEKGATQLRAPGTRSKVIEAPFGDAAYMQPGAEFDWPLVPRMDGGASDLRVYTEAPSSGGFTAHLMDPLQERAFFFAWSPRTKVLFGYVWNRSDFPWLSLWEENCGRTDPPWNGRTLTRGIEIGTSPMPETRRQMLERGKLFGAPCYRWIPARTEVRLEYSAFLTTADAIPETLEDLRVR